MEQLQKSLSAISTIAFTAERSLHKETGRDPSARPLDVVRRKPHVGNRLRLPGGAAFTSRQGNGNPGAASCHPGRYVSDSEICAPPPLDVSRLDDADRFSYTVGPSPRAPNTTQHRPARDPPPAEQLVRNLALGFQRSKGGSASSSRIPSKAAGASSRLPPPPRTSSRFR